MHRFFVPAVDVSPTAVTFTSEQTHQLRHVLRLKVGDKVVVFDDSGGEYEVVLATLGSERATGAVDQYRQVDREAQQHLTLYQALLKRDKFEWVLQKCTEVGVAAFVPVVTERSLVRDIRIKESKLRRWQKIIVEAAEQSGRTRLPRLLPPVTWAEALTAVTDTPLRLLAWEAANGQDIGVAVAAVDRAQALRASLFIGPEGGFSQQEAALAQSHQVVPITLGPRILRAETAAVVASALLLQELDSARLRAAS